jgi:hypothetical protein
VHLEWAKAADSFLAVTYASTASPQQVVDLKRLLVIWALLERLSGGSTPSGQELDALLREAVVVLPGDLEVQPASPQPTVRPTTITEEPSLSEALKRYRWLTSAGEEIKTALRSVDPTATAVEPLADAGAPPDLALRMDALPGLSDATREALAEFGDDSIPNALSRLDRAADRALTDHAASAAVADREIFRRRAIAAENLRLRPWLKAAVPGAASATAAAAGVDGSPGRLLSPPVLGDLKVVRQTLAGYELGEIAHVENVLAGETKIRRHQVVDVTESEMIETERREEEQQRDQQTTTRSELGTETQSVIDRDESFNAGGTISASYGPYVSATATVGVAQSKSESETTRVSTRFAQDVTERATDRLRTSTEQVRRSLTRNTITEENEHRLQGSSQNTVGVYRWVNKRYCAQVYNYGLRVLLDVGVPDPSVGYRFAAELGTDLQVDADPPPRLVIPGTDIALAPQRIAASNWQTLAATFRVAEFPPPPEFFVTVPFAWSQESPQQAPAASGGASAPSGVSPRLFKSARELTLPEGYLPLRFEACVLVDGPSGLYGDRISDAERMVLRANTGTAIPAAPREKQDRLRQLIEMWLAWDPSAMPRPPIDLDDIGLLTTYIVPTFGATASPPLAGLLAFMASAVGGFRPGLELAVGPNLTWAPPGAHKVSGVFNWGQSGTTPPEITTTTSDSAMLPIAISTSGGQGFSLTLEVLAHLTTAEARWQQEAYNAILAAHSAWETDWRSAVAQAQIARGISISGRNPLENAETIRNELKRSVITLLGAPEASVLDVVTTGDPVPTGDPPEPTAPSMDLERAGEAARLVAFYEQAFEWQNMTYSLYPYFWTGREDWPEALARQDADPLFAQFLRSGSARVVLPVRPGFERVVQSRLSLRLPSAAISAASPLPAVGPYLDIAEEIRESQNSQQGGKPSGSPWSVVVPTTLVALDGTPMPTYATACDPAREDLDDVGLAGDDHDHRVRPGYDVTRA